MASIAATPVHQPDKKEIRLVIAASSAGTAFEWYDFFIYGTLAALIGQAFFPAGNETLSLLLTWAGFAVGFCFRPLGAILFGYLGDRLGRKYTFLVTVTLMGVATAGVGLIPSAESIGLAAPILVLILRILQGLALGGEYGGAAIYVAEHAPANRRGRYTSFIQGAVVGGFVLSLVVVLACRFLIPPDDFIAWGWRLPFLLSILLLAISLWMRLKLNESPVFRAMKEEGEVSKNPFVESFTYPGNKKRVFVAMMGVACGLTIVFYTALFSSLTFLKGPMRMDDTVAEMLVASSSLFGLFFFIYFGNLSDRVGRKKPIVWGYVASLVLLFPCFWLMAQFANPQLAESTRAAPVTISGPDCSYDPFANTQGTVCGQLMEEMTDIGLPYAIETAAEPAISIGSQLHLASSIAMDDPDARQTAIIEWLKDGGYNFEDQIPPVANIAGLAVVLIVLASLSGATFGPVAALLSEMFPPKIRYSSMSIPYNIGTGYFGGFLPLIAGYIVARTGDIFAGLWYTWVMLVVALVVAWWGLPSGPPRDFADDVG